MPRMPCGVPPRASPQCPRACEYAFIYTAHEHIWELQALCGVYGHHRHRILVLLPVIVRVESYALQIFLQRILLTGGLLIFVYRLLQLCQVVQPFLFARLPEHRLVARGGHELRHKIRQTFLLVCLPEIFYDIDKG